MTISKVVEVNEVIEQNDNTNYKVIDCRVISKSKKENLVITGIFIDIKIGDVLRVKGKKKDGLRGLEIEVDDYRIEYPIDKNAIIDYLVDNVRSIGIVTAEVLVEKFGKDLFRVIEKDSDRLKEIGMSEKQIIDIKSSLVNKKELQEVLVYFTNNNISLKKAKEIYDKFGSLSIEILKDNPYLASLENIITFKEADIIAKNNKLKAYNNNRIKQGIIELIINNTNKNGDIYIEKKVMEEKLCNILKATDVYKHDSQDNKIIKERFEDIIRELIHEKRIVIEENEEKEKCVYLRHYNNMENSIVEEVRLRKDKTTNISVDKVREKIDIYEEENEYKFDIKQKKAIEMALVNNISIIGGGPGTGKTETIKAIVEIAKKINNNIEINLTAPTGKASKKLTDTIGMEGVTLHRLLGINEEGIDIRVVNPDILIIDEFSMVDIELFYYTLLSADDDTSIVIVGDYNQLPSIGPGSILKDLIDSKEIKNTILTKVFRQAVGSKIIDNSYKIVNKDIDLKFDDNATGESYFLETKSKDIINNILVVIDRLINGRGYKFSDIQVLTFMNKGSLGVKEINKEIQENFNRNNKRWVDTGEEIIKIGDRVVHNINNYDLEVFNGDVGIVEDIGLGDNEKTNLVVKYDHKTVLYDNTNINQLSLAYAITIHKSQGSEFPATIIPIDKSMEVMTYNKVLYTASSRAKEIVFMLGDKEVLIEGIKKERNCNRKSLIKEKLKDKKEKKEEKEKVADLDFDIESIKIKIKELEEELEKIREDIIERAKEEGVKYPSLISKKSVKYIENRTNLNKEIGKYREITDKVKKMNSLIIYMLENGKEVKYHTNIKGNVYYKGFSIPFNNKELLELTGELVGSPTPSTMYYYTKEILKANIEDREVIKNNKSVVSFLPIGDRVFVKRKEEYKEKDGKWEWINKEEVEQYERDIEDIKVVERVRESKKIEKAAESIISDRAF